MTNDKTPPQATEIDDAALDQASGGKAGAGTMVLTQGGGTAAGKPQPAPPPPPPSGLIKVGPGTLA